MATLTAAAIIKRCIDTLQDPTSVRWPIIELIRYLNDGQREVAMHRPDAMVKTATVTLASDTRQKLVAGAAGSPGAVGTGIEPAKLIDITRNLTGPARQAVRLINREVLDAQLPTWHDSAASKIIKHFMFDARDPLAFFVYPKADSATSVEVVFGAYPKSIHEADFADWAALSLSPTSGIAVVDIPDIFSNAVIDYILYRSYSKDSEYAGNSQRAQNHYTSFANALGVELNGTIGVAPMTSDNPNYSGRRTNSASTTN